MGVFPDYYIINSLDEELISMNLIKSYLRIDSDHEDNLLRIFTKSAIEYAEGFTGLSISHKLIEANFYQWKEEGFNLPRIPAMSIEQVVVVDSFGKRKKIPKTSYRFDDKKLFLEAEIFRGYKLNVTYKTGYSKVGMPPMLLEALLSHIAVMFENRGGESLPPARILNVYLRYKRVKI